MLHVVIVGAGIAGLAAAVALRRAGHRVHLYEQSSLGGEVGAAITVPPNASRILLAWGVRPADWGFVPSEGASSHDPFTMAKTADLTTREAARDAGGAPLYLAHRVDLHGCLAWLATRDGGPGVPATLHRGCGVAAIDPTAPAITLRDGRRICADLVVGADGVHSRAAAAVLRREVEARPPRHANACYRFLIPAAVLEEDPATRAWNAANRSRTRIFPDDETQRRLVSYVCRDNTVHNFVGIFHDESTELGTAEDWQASVEVDEMVDKFSDFHPDIVNVMRKAKDVKRWPLLYRPPLDSWHREMLVLVGDAAHPMLPHHGQGGAQAIEDGLVLGVAMCGARASREDVRARLGTYEETRRCRASVIQVLSNVGQDQALRLRHEALPYLPEEEIPTTPAQIQRFNFGHDAAEAAVAAMRRRDPQFGLPRDFFDGPVVGVPGRKGPAAAAAAAVLGRGASHCGGEMPVGGRAAVEIS